MSNRFIIAREDFTLPAVCLSSGAIDGLVEKSRTFRVVPKTVARVVLAARLIGAIILLQLLPEVGNLRNVGPPHVVFAVVLVGLLLTPLITRRVAEPIHATWFISQRLLRRNLLLIIFAALSVAAAVLVMQAEQLEIAQLGTVRSSWIFVLLLLAAAVLLSFRSRTLVSQGKIRDLFVFAGFSRRFYDTVIEREKSDYLEGQH